MTLTQLLYHYLMLQLYGQLHAVMQYHKYDLGKIQISYEEGCYSDSHVLLVNRKKFIQPILVNHKEYFGLLTLGSVNTCSILYNFGYLEVILFY